MATKPTDIRTAKTATAKAAAKLSNTDTHTANAERIARINELMMDAAPVPTAARQMIAAVAQLASFSGSIYWGMSIVNWLMTAAVVYTGSAFLAFVIGVVAFVMAARAAWHAGTAVADFVLNFQFTDAADVGRDLRVAASRRVSLVKGWFKRDDDRIEVTA